MSDGEKPTSVGRAIALAIAASVWDVALGVYIVHMAWHAVAVGVLHLPPLGWGNAVLVSLVLRVGRQW